MFDWRLLRPNGEVWDAEVHLSPFGFGGRDLFQFIILDMTERKRAAERLRLEQLFSKTLIDSLPGIFYLYSYPELRLVRWNKNHEILLGFGPGEIDGRYIMEWHVPEAENAVREAIEVAMKTGLNSIEAPLVAKDGRLIHFLMTGAKLESGGRRYLMGFGIDVSDRRKVEEENRALYAQMENRVKERTVQLSEANEVLAKTLRELRETQAQVLVSEKMAALGQLIAGIAHGLNNPLGAILSAAVAEGRLTKRLPKILSQYRSLDDEEERVFLDLLKRMKIHPNQEGSEGLRELKRAYKKALEERGVRHAALLADHLVDCGIILTSEEISALAGMERISGLIETLYQLSTYYRSDEIIREAAEKSFKVVDALNIYIQRNPRDRRSPVNVESGLEEVLRLFRNQTKHGVEIVRRYRNVSEVPAFENQLKQVWMSLISNALQAMGYRGRLELELEEDEDEVRVAIIDDGPGIPEEIRGRVFEPFFTTKMPGEGTGLGLDICKRVMEKIGGRIDFESRPGNTRFTVHLRKESDHETRQGHSLRR